LAKELIAAAKESGLPVSVKTRLGYNQIDLTWLEDLLVCKPTALTVHLRTRKEMSKVPAHWEVMGEIMKLAEGSGVLILGNGDVKNLAEAREKCEQYACDGVMLGRAIFGNPWLFAEYEPTLEERKAVLAEHIKLFTQLLPGKNFAVMKKHFKAYIPDKELRDKLMAAQTPEEAELILTNYR
jgi:tRNA-dihydrouridine synthase